jgi:hypothetical protein
MTDGQMLGVYELIAGLRLIGRDFAPVDDQSSLQARHESKPRSAVSACLPF